MFSISNHRHPSTCLPHAGTSKCDDYSGLGPYDTLLFFITFLASIVALGVIGISVVKCVSSLCSPDQTGTNLAALQMVSVTTETTPQSQQVRPDATLLTLESDGESETRGMRFSG